MPESIAPADTWSKTLDAWLHIHANATRSGDIKMRDYAWVRIGFWLGSN